MKNRPEHLQPGDSIGIVAPSALFGRDTLDKSIAFVEKWGLKPVLGRNILKKDFIYSGKTEERVSDFLSFAHDPKIKAIWCIRGGYGSWPLAEAIKKSRIPKTSKILIGMSDIGFIHMAVQKFWKWPVLHGPLFSRLHRPRSAQEINCLHETLFNPDYKLQIEKGLKFWGRKGKAVGPLVGGNIAIAAASLGSPWEIDTRGKILLLEDVGERAFRLDRMIFQLKMAGKFDKIKGLVLGDFTECVEPDGKELWKECLKRNFENAPFPVVLGVRAGHGDVQLSLPLGAQTQIISGSKTSLKILESYVR
jgi:muramoyltetrapeptide carboxypeptidase